MKYTFVFVFLSLLSSICIAQKTTVTFNVFFKDKNIGTMQATEVRSGTKSIKDLKTNTDVSVFMMSIHVESEVKSTHDNGLLIQGSSYRHANRGSEDVIASVKRIGEKVYEKVRNGKKGRLEKTDISICVIDLFFREPKGVKVVFSNMYADFLTLKEVSPGKYMLITPDDKNSYYTYQNGKLMSVETNTPLGKVITKRIQ
jgi:hypothetical protein